jgi:hypothetical protein
VSFDIFLERIAEVADDRSVWSLLEAAWDAPPDEHNYVRARRGAGEADLYTGPLDEPVQSLMFSRPAGGHEIFDLIVDVAQAGRMVIMPVGCPPCVAAASELETFPSDIAESLGQPVVVSNGHQLLELIEKA